MQLKLMSKLRLFWAKETKISSLEGRELMFEHEDNNAKTMNNQVGDLGCNHIYKEPDWL